jgi:hypothetical protein
MKTMIGILIAVMVVVGVVAGADLLLSFALIRRVAALTSGGVGAGPVVDAPALGHEVSAFGVPLLDGGEFSRADLTGTRALAVFLTTSCEPCRKAITELRTLSVPLPGPLYVVIVRTDADTDSDVFDAAAGMPAGARVGIVSSAQAPLQAFGIDGFPTVLTLDDGVVSASGFRVAALLDDVSR